MQTQATTVYHPRHQIHKQDVTPPFYLCNSLLSTSLPSTCRSSRTSTHRSATTFQIAHKFTYRSATTFRIAHTHKLPTAYISPKFLQTLANFAPFGFQNSFSRSDTRQSGHTQQYYNKGFIANKIVLHPISNYFTRTRG